MKKETIQLRNEIVNTTYYTIYKDLEHKMSLEELAKLNSVSKYHYHRIIKEETNQTLFELIASIRLQKAANLLITNQYSSISHIASMCGYMSHSSFIKAFKNKYKYTPTLWREGAYKTYSKGLLKEHPSTQDFTQLEPIIKVCPRYRCIYLRHKGYNKSIKKTWERLLAIAYENNIQNPTEIALFHDNPAITALDICAYVACIETQKQLPHLSTLEIPESLCAVFQLEGVYGDLVNLIRYVYHFWLPHSVYEAKTLPAYVLYHQNLFTKEVSHFTIDLHVPICVRY